MSEIVKIIMRGESPLQNPREIYKDRLVIEPAAIMYEYHPLFKTERNPARMWEYKSDSPDYAKLYADLCRTVPEVLATENKEFDHEAACTQFEVVYADGRKEKETFYLKRDEFKNCFGIAKQMVPECEYTPAVLLNEDDWR